MSERRLHVAASPRERRRMPLTVDLRPLPRLVACALEALLEEEDVRFRLLTRGARAAPPGSVRVTVRPGTARRGAVLLVEPGEARLLAEGVERAAACLSWDSPPGTLVEAVLHAARAELWVDPALAPDLGASLRHTVDLLAEVRRPLRRLTPRECEVVAALLREPDRRACARALFLTPSTVETHLSHARTRARCGSLVELLVQVARCRALQRRVELLRAARAPLRPQGLTTRAG